MPITISVEMIDRREARKKKGKDKKGPQGVKPPGQNERNRPNPREGWIDSRNRGQGDWPTGRLGGQGISTNPWHGQRDWSKFNRTKGIESNSTKFSKEVIRRRMTGKNAVGNSRRLKA